MSVDTGTAEHLPAGWRWARLGEVCEQDRSIVEPLTAEADTLPYYGLEHIEGNTGRILKESAVADESAGKSTTFRFDVRHVLYGKLRPYLNKVALPDMPGRCTTELIPLLPNAFIERVFLAWLLRRPETVAYAMKDKTGSRMPRADMNSLLRLDIPLPTLSEQRRIIAVLSERMAAVDRARAAAEARLEAVKALGVAYLRAAFPGVGETLPAGWRWAKLGEVCEQDTGKRDPRLTPNTQFRYVDITGVSNVDKRIVDAKQLPGYDAPSRARQVIRENDVIVATTRPNLNAVALVSAELDNQICSTGFCVLRSKDALLPEFLFAFVKHESFVDSLSGLVRGALYPAVTERQVKDQPIPLPPISEQRRIVAMLGERMAAVYRARTAAEEELTTINALPAAILRRAFNGEM